MRAGGEIVAKVASVAFFVVMARVLTKDAFGIFIFGMSLSQLVLEFAAVGSQDLIAREVSRDRSRVHELFYNFLAMKAALLAALSLAICGVIFFADYSNTEVIAIALITVGTAVEMQTSTYYAVFQAHERNEFVAGTLIVQRGMTACIGIAVLLAGGGLIAAAAVYCLGTMVGQSAAYLFLHRKVISPQRQINLDRWVALMRASVPLGFVSLAYFALIELDGVLLGFLSSKAEVGIYGAAYRLVNATMFISWSFSGAMVPWLARHNEGSGATSLSRGYELGLKVLSAMLMPIGAAYIVFATPLIHTLYGSSYDAAIAPLRWLGAMTVLYGINNFVAVLAIQREHPADFALPTAFIFVQNLIFNLILIPHYHATGAAFNAVLSGVLLAIWTSIRAQRRIGRVNFVRALATPVLGSAAMAGVVFLLGPTLTPLPIIAGGLTYAVVFVVLERVVFPADFRFYVNALPARFRLPRSAPS
jgi:O-antigen/teichoic acid export membrane protein